MRRHYLKLLITNGGAYAITWPSVTWVGGKVPVLSANATDIVTLVTYDGSNWVAMASVDTVVEHMADTFIFQTPGTHTTTVPSWATMALISGCAGGGGGRQSGSATEGSIYDSGGGGGAGGHCINYLVKVIAGQTYIVTIGAGGSGEPGMTGGATSFGSLLSLSGGAGGYDGLGIASNGEGTIDVGYTSAGPGSVYPPVGNSGGGLFGVGGPAQMTRGDGREGTGYGAGGSGSVGGIGCLGGDGRPGFLIIRWVV